ncbi:MAG: three-Cys-motif partner protein TcmP [Pseudohongiellaceae bacterium]
MANSFGGPWTAKKLELLEAYLHFYATALKNQNFTLHYVDAFAGTGAVSPRRLEGDEFLIPPEDLEGSVSRALAVEPGFHYYHFNDLDQQHSAKLRELEALHPGRNIHIYQQDANDFVREICSRLKSRDRAVMFLDPFSSELEWATLEVVAASGKVDLWLLFPFLTLLRITPRDGGKIRDEWRNAANRLLGTDDWEQWLYQPEEQNPTPDLFAEESSCRGSERSRADDVAKSITRRLQDIFPYVAEPVHLRNRGRPLFLFYFAVSNPNPAAQGLAKRVVDDIRRKNAK